MMHPAAARHDHMTFITELERGIDAKTADEGNDMRLVLIQYLKILN
jgi:hypothetical protein